MKVLIVDDERFARMRLIQLLAALEDIDVVGEACNADEARELVTETEPDLLLLDIQMPGLDGLSLARELAVPSVIFTTAHREYAADAFEVRAIDYLLKPVKRDRLIEALEKFRTHRDREMLREVRQLLGTLRTASNAAGPVRITARDRQGYELFDARDIARFWASDKYVLFRFEGREILLEQSLSDLESMLKDHDFFRVHRSELINLRQVRRITFDGRRCELALTDGQVVSASRRLVPALKQRLGLSSDLSA